MDKKEFLEKLGKGLSGLPRDDAEERLSFYGEMIDDRVEEGISEEEAVAGIGPVEDIVSQTLADIPLPKLVKERVRPERRLRAWEIILLALGSPIWLSLLIALFAVVISVYAVIWSLIISLFAVEISLIVSALAGIAAGILLICRGSLPQGMLLIGAGILLAGLSVFLFFGCIAAAKGAVKLTGKIALGIKSLFVRKEKTK